LSGPGRLANPSCQVQRLMVPRDPSKKDHTDPRSVIVLRHEDGCLMARGISTQARAMVPVRARSCAEAGVRACGRLLIGGTECAYEYKK